MVKDGKSIQSNLSELSVLAENTQTVPILVHRSSKEVIFNHIVLARTKKENEVMAKQQRKRKK